MTTKKCCLVCDKYVNKAHKSLDCAVCCKTTHLTCLGLSNAEYVAYKQNHAWYCEYCLSKILPFNCIVDDIEFRNCIFSYSRSPNVNASLIHNTQQLQLFSNLRLCSDGIDPDKHLLNHFAASNDAYYLEDSFSALTDKIGLRTKETFSLIHFNIRSLPKNRENLLAYLSQFHQKFTVIAISETWANEENQNLLNIPGYNKILKNRTTSSTGGGVALYILDGYTSQVREDYAFPTSSIVDSLFIDLSGPNVNKKTIGVVYRPPNSDIKQFLQDFQVITKKMTCKKAECLITGDFNLNLLKHDVHSDTGCFLNGLLHDSFMPLITRPTRFSETSSTLIDNIFTNKIFDKYISGTLITDISDHLPIFYIETINKMLQMHLPNTKKTLTFYKRNLSDSKLNELKHKLSNIDWSPVLTSADANSAYNSFFTKFTSCYNECLPLELKEIKCRNQICKPWITPCILKSIRKKNKLYKDYLNNSNTENVSKYKTYKNKLTKIIRSAEKLHYSNKFQQAQGNLSKTWEIIKKLINPDQSKKPINEIKLDNNTITDTKVIANKFNEYFTNVGPLLANKIPVVSGDPLKFIPGDFSKSMALYETDPSEIIHIAQQLKTSTSKGHDGILPYVIKQTIDVIATPLSIIFNLSLKNGIFPDELKIARVVPIYKSDSKTVISNYRPISILPFISKILERLMYDRVQSFLNKNDILTKNQYGFREKHSTYMALLKLVDQITEKLNNKQFTIGIFIDLSKAFDTIDHKILISKLQHYGIRGIALEWFKSYLTNRHQYVNIGESNSSMQHVSCGIPQGSILGPMLFIIYINDITFASKIADLIMFADDTNLFYSHVNLDVLCNVINNDLCKISTWFKLNKLSINIKKLTL